MAGLADPLLEAVGPAVTVEMRYSLLEALQPGVQAVPVVIVKTVMPVAMVVMVETQ